MLIKSHIGKHSEKLKLYVNARCYDGLVNDKEQLQRDHRVDQNTSTFQLRVARPPGILLQNHDLIVSHFKLMNGDGPSTSC